jgi:cysteine synthase A
MNSSQCHLARSILDVIGRTPLLQLSRSVESRGLNGRLLVKLEYFNPGGSKKDRIALEIVRDARASGELRPGQTVVELTSGNTGTGLAIVCRALGHPFVAVISRGNSIERVRQMTAFGAEVVVVDQAEGAIDGQVSGEDLQLVEERAAEIVAQRGAFRVDQFRREANILAHERHTGPELWEQSDGKVDVFVDMVGTCGSFTGVTRALRRLNPALRSYVVEPSGAAVLGGGSVSNPRHRIQGAGYARVDLALFDRSLATGFVSVTDEQAIAASRHLAVEEGVFAGFSTGAHLAAAWKLLAEQESGATIAFLACDSGLKYLSTDLFP